MLHANDSREDVLGLEKGWSWPKLHLHGLHQMVNIALCFPGDFVVRDGGRAMRDLSVEQAG